VNKKIKDGGAAFPHQDVPVAGSGGGFLPSRGMTLRDFFASAAMQGIIGGIDRNSTRFLDGTHYPAGKLASAAYNIADAMIEAREGSK
jgi:hypothetical protein